MRQMILPRGFPQSVSPGYEGYTGWLAAGLFAHSFTVMVSTNALLSGFFAEMSAASWLMKDLLPPLLAGTLASRIRTLEANPKKWLGAACFANSLFGVAEFLIPHLLPKESWMLLAICTNVGKMTGYLVIGATRAVLQKTLATGDNLGEVTAKLGTLGMLMHCFGAATALTLVHLLDFWGQLAALSAGAAVGFYAPVRASQCAAYTWTWLRPWVISPSPHPHPYPYHHPTTTSTPALSLPPSPPAPLPTLTLTPALAFTSIPRLPTSPELVQPPLPPLTPGASSCRLSA